MFQKSDCLFLRLKCQWQFFSAICKESLGKTPVPHKPRLIVLFLLDRPAKDSTSLHYTQLNRSSVSAPRLPQYGWSEFLPSNRMRLSPAKMITQCCISWFNVPNIKFTSWLHDWTIAQQSGQNWETPLLIIRWTELHVRLSFVALRGHTDKVRSHCGIDSDQGLFNLRTDLTLKSGEVGSHARRWWICKL